MSTEKRKSIALLTFVSRFSAIDFPVYICDSCAILDSRKGKINCFSSFNSTNSCIKQSKHYVENRFIMLYNDVRKCFGGRITNVNW